MSVKRNYTGKKHRAVLNPSNAISSLVLIYIELIFTDLKLSQILLWRWSFVLDSLAPSEVIEEVDGKTGYGRVKWVPTSHHALPAEFMIDSCPNGSEKQEHWLYWYVNLMY